MADNSERIIILSALILILIILWSPSRLVKIVPIGTWTMRDLLDPEHALEHGFKGYVNVSYVSETPRIVIVSPGKTLNYTIQLKLIPHVPEFTETLVVLDPENSSGRGVGPGDLIFNDYIHYSPGGTILLSVDEPRNITMILSVPEGLPGMSGSPQDLLGVGIMANIPVAYEGGAHLDIPKAEYQRPIVSLSDVVVEVETEKEIYFLGENFTTTIYLVNNCSEDVWLKPISEFTISASSVNDPEPVAHGFHITWEEGTLIHVPAGSRTRLIEERITPKYPGSFNINCLGAHLSLDVIDPEEMWLDNETLVSKVILYAFDLREIIESGRKEYVAISPSEIGLINVTIELGEIVRGEDAEMMKGYEVPSPMTPYVRYFTVKRIRTRVPSRVVGERRGWLDMLGRCYVYYGWDEL